MNKGIITLKAWKRPYYLKQVLDSIAAAPGHENYDYYISIDFHLQTNKQSLDILKKFESDNPDLNFKYQVSSISLGCAGNMKHCQEYAFMHNDYDYMIHFEDDTIAGRDIFTWYECAREKYGNDPELFAITPFSPNNGRNGMQSREQVTQSFKTDRFACQGGFLITRNIHTMIYRNGGIFGIHGCNAKLDVTPPEQFKNHVGRIHLSGSWAIPYEHYFLRIDGQKYTIIPKVSRSNNIGSKEGVWNPSEKWHMDNVYNKYWIESPEFSDIDCSSLVYEDVSEYVKH